MEIYSLTMEPSVAVVILNWNGKNWLEKFLPSVIASDYSNLQIIVGDNASTDDSVSFLQTNFPQVAILENDENYGFAGGYNHVLARVKADYFVLLNSDVEVPKDWIKPVIELMESDAKIAVAQPKIKSQLNKDDFEYAGASGGFIDIYGFPFCRGRIFDEVEKDSGQYNENIDIFWASGAAFFIKSAAWTEVGGLDADLFAHMEEIDLCWRLKNLGYRILSCSEAEVYHVGGGTLNVENPHKTYLNFRNNLIIMQKNLPSKGLRMKIFIRMWFDLAAWTQFLFKGKPAFTKAISKAHYDFLKNYQKTTLKRTNKQLEFTAHTGVFNKSVVKSFFIDKIKTFSKLPW